MIDNTASMDRSLAGQRRPRRLAAMSVGALLLLVVAGALFSTIQRWSRADRAVDASALRFGTVARGELLRDLSAQARVAAALSSTLYSPGQGIVSLRTRAGSQVKRGDVLAVIDSKELVAALDQAKSQQLTSAAELQRQRIVARQADLRANEQAELTVLRLAAADRQLERAKRTFKEGLSNRADYEAAQDNARIAAMEVEQAKNERELARETNHFEVATREQQLKRNESITGELQKRVDGLTIPAPFDGMVSAVSVQDRDAVGPNQAVLAVVNLSSLELQAGLPEEYANETAVGTPAVISHLDHDYSGKVTRVSPEVVSGEVMVTIAFDGPLPPGLRQNQRVTVRLTFESKRNVLKVARGAFIEAEGGRAAYVVHDRMATRRDIVTGASSVGEIEIVKGLSPGETIVLSDTTAFGHVKNVMLR